MRLTLLLAWIITVVCRPLAAGLAGLARRCERGRDACERVADRYGATPVYALACADGVTRYVDGRQADLHDAVARELAKGHGPVQTGRAWLEERVLRRMPDDVLYG